MLKKLFSRFTGSDDFPKTTEIAISRIDKHMNFMLRDNLGNINKNILSTISNISSKKEEILMALRELHKAKLHNTNIPGREIHIMDGNRDTYIKRVSHFVSNIEVPKNYLDTYDYCIKFSQELEALNKEIQKNVFVLHHFFANEIKIVNKELHDLEEHIINIRVMLEKNGVETLKEIQQDIKNFTNNLVKITNLKGHIDEEKANISIHQDKLDKLNKRIETIISGSDYKALEAFKEEKEGAQNSIDILSKKLSEDFSQIETALKKYYYLNPDKKLAKDYLENVKDALILDEKLEIVQIVESMKLLVQNDQIELKDNKKEKCLEAINKITADKLRTSRVEMLKLEDLKQRAQSKITHNSASLNVSEQQYWAKATEDKIAYHNSNIEKLNKNIGIIEIENEEILNKIKVELQKLLDTEIKIIDDVTDNILKGKPLKEETV